MRALVTGAGGFIGSHLVEQLVARFGSAAAFVHYRADGSHGWLDRALQVAVTAGDISDPHRIEYASRGCTHIFHLAAQISIPHSYESPLSFIRANVEGTLNVLTAARKHDCRVVLMSTSETYGSAQYIPMDEKHPANAQSPYAATKVAADQLGLSFWRVFGTDVVIARPFNVYGPRQSQRSVIPNVIRQLLLAPDQPVRVGTLTASRDFTYVTDTAHALIELALSGESGTVYNIGSGTDYTVDELVRRIASVLGLHACGQIDMAYVRPPASEVQKLLCDASRINGIGWLPYVKLDDGLQRVVEWMRPRVEELREGRVT